MNLGLWEWWEGLSRPQRVELMFVGGDALPPGLAKAIASGAGSLEVVRQVHAAVGDEWYLTGEAERFVGDREYERRHPDEDAVGGSRTVYSMSQAAPRRVELLYTESCPNWETTAIRLSIALQVTGRESLDVEIRRIDTPEQAAEQRFTGSPMIRLDGADPFHERGLAIGLSCRVYRDGVDAVAGPTLGEIVDALLAYDR